MGYSPWSSFGGSLATGAIQAATGGLLDATFGQITGSLNDRRAWKMYQKQMELNHKYFMKQADYSADIAREQYDYEYSKESPTARRSQLESAGLNAGLMYSNGTQGMQGSVNTSIPSAPSAHMSAQPSSALRTLQLGQSAVLASQVEANQAQANKLNAEADDIRGNTPEARQRIIGYELSNRINQVNAEIAEATKQDRINMSTEELQKLKNENDQLIADVAHKYSMADRNSQESRLLEEQLRTQIKQTAILDIKLKYQDKYTQAEIDKLVAEANKCIADTDYVKQLNLSEKERTEVEKLAKEAHDLNNQILKVHSKQSTDRFGRVMQRLGSITGMIGNIFGGSVVFKFASVDKK